MPRALSSFRARLLLVVAVALFVRIAAVMAGYQHLPLGLDDNNGYHIQSLLLADHGGFYEPFVCLDSVRADGDPFSSDALTAACRERGELEPSAGHPPLFPGYLAVVSLLGFESVLEHRLASCLLGAAAVALIGLVARRIAGDRAGLIAAALAAVYPNLWINDGLILAESGYTVAIGLFLLAAYRFWQERSIARAVVLGVAVGAAALTRSEGLLLLGFVVLPLMVVARGPWKRRVAQFAVSGLVAVAIVAPWVAYNMSRFDEPVLLASGTGRVLAYGNCDATYYGPKIGYWDQSCAPTAEALVGDESVIDTAHREKAVAYVSDHLGRAPVVVAARIGRMWGLYRPLEGMRLDIFFERRGQWPSRLALAMYAILLPASIAGLVVMRRRRVTIVPMVGIAAMVTFTAAVSFGVTRYRVPVDVILTILAGVAADAVLRRWWTPDEAAAEDGPAPIAPDGEPDGGLEPDDLPVLAR